MPCCCSMGMLVNKISNPWGEDDSSIPAGSSRIKIYKDGVEKYNHVSYIDTGYAVPQINGEIYQSGKTAYVDLASIYDDTDSLIFSDNFDTLDTNLWEAIDQWTPMGSVENSKWVLRNGGAGIRYKGANKADNSKHWRMSFIASVEFFTEFSNSSGLYLRGENSTDNTQIYMVPNQGSQYDFVNRYGATVNIGPLQQGYHVWDMVYRVSPN